jgi:manganese transport protein
MTGTLAGQVVMEGFVRIRLRPWVRRLLTRSLAIAPALLVIGLASHDSLDVTALAEGAADAGTIAPIDKRLFQLLVLSQAILSFQLPFAIVPLVHFTSDRQRMGTFASRGWLKLLAWICALIVVGLNGVLIFLQMGEWAEGIEESGWSPMWIYGTVGPLAVGLASFLAWITAYPYWHARAEEPLSPAAPRLPGVTYRRLGVAVEFEGADDAVLAQAAAVARSHGATLTVIHVVEGIGAAFHGPETDDAESREDRRQMAQLVNYLRSKELEAEGVLGYGSPVEELVRIATERRLDLLVLGTHGHRFLADLALGQTVSPLLHRLSIPVLVVPNRPTVLKPPAETVASDKKPD